MQCVPSRHCARLVICTFQKDFKKCSTKIAKSAKKSKNQIKTVKSARKKGAACAIQTLCPHSHLHFSLLFRAVTASLVSTFLLFSQLLSSTFSQLFSSILIVLTFPTGCLVTVLQLKSTFLLQSHRIRSTTKM